MFCWFKKQPPRPSTKIKLKETTENAVKETSKVSFTMTSGGSVSALSYTTKKH
jgi:hypothetical protein